MNRLLPTTRTYQLRDGRVEITKFNWQDVLLNKTQRVAKQIQAIGLAAWAEADWLAHKFDGNRDVRAVATTAYNPHNPYHVNRQARELTRSLFGGSQQFLLATLIDDRDMPVVGFARTSSEQPPSDGPAKRSIKRSADAMRGVGLINPTSLASRALRVYGSVYEVNVSPYYQGGGIGAALYHASLSEQQPAHIPVAYMEVNDHASRQWFKENHFMETGTATQFQKFAPGIPYNELRMECVAQTVRDVLGRLEHQYPYLQNPTISQELTYQ